LGLITLSACGGVGVSTEGVAVKQIPALNAETPVPVVPNVSGDLLTSYQGTLENIYSAVSPSVVNIRVVQKVSASSLGAAQIPGFPFFNLPQNNNSQQQYQSALGSGFVWDRGGHIVTNNHVVSGADKIEVTFSDGTIVPATLVGADPDSDLAVVKVDVAADKLTPVQMGDSALIKVGQIAIAIGNPFGLEGSMTTGIISAVGRSLPADENAVQSYTIPDIIQTDAPINPGNSGGVLLDLEGNVLGVTSAIESPVRANAGIGFAIPSAIVKNIVPVLITDGKYIHSWLGISGTTLVPDLAKAMNLDEGQRGALVEEIMPNSPAEKAGLQSSDQQITIDGNNTNVGGDVITAIDDQPVLEMDDLIAYLASSTKVDQNVTLTILRDGKEQKLEVTLAARPSAEERTSSQPTQGIRLGIAGMDMNEIVANAMNLPSNQQGVLVVQVEQGGLADEAGLRSGSDVIDVNGQQVNVGGDVITAVNGQSIKDVQELKAMLAGLSSDQSLTLTILRDGKELEITLNSGQ
jgi:S1-C subfamily serine protease